MSTLEKAIGLLQKMPKHKLETVYTYMCFVDSQTDDVESASSEKNTSDPIARKQRGGFQGLLSFAGTLPEDFDYRKELDVSNIYYILRKRLSATDRRKLLLDLLDLLQVSNRVVLRQFAAKLLKRLQLFIFLRQNHRMADLL